MTNEKIIEGARQALIEAGTIKAGEMIHTYEGWKAAGMQVKRGQKAVARFSIWKKGSKMVDVPAKDSEGNDTTTTADVGKFFLKESCFFASSQVEPLKGKKSA